MWFRQSCFDALMLNDPADLILLDLETTGLSQYHDEILQISIINGRGDELLTSYVKPMVARAWPEAQAVNGITPRMVEDAPDIDDLSMEICRLLFGAKVIAGYNIINFDMPFLAHFLPTPCDMDHDGQVAVVDVMLDYAPIAGEWNEAHGDWRWQSLTKCARHFGIEFTAHDAHEDIETTRRCLIEIAKVQSNKFRRS